MAWGLDYNYCPGVESKKMAQRRVGKYYHSKYLHEVDVKFVLIEETSRLHVISTLHAATHLSLAIPNNDFMEALCQSQVV